MNGINVAALVSKANTVSGRALVVQSDPAVRKAVVTACTDVAVAFKSVAKACVEVKSAWNRATPATSLRLAA